VAAAKLFDGGSGLRLQDGNDLFFAVSGWLHGSWIGMLLSGADHQPSSGLITGVSSMGSNETRLSCRPPARDLVTKAGAFWTSLSLEITACDRYLGNKSSDAI
jgi:hypothetical protein